MVISPTTALLFKYYTKSCIYFYIIELYVLLTSIKYYISIRNNNISLINYIKDVIIYILIFTSLYILAELINDIKFLLTLI